MANDYQMLIGGKWVDAARMYQFFAGYCDKLYGEVIPMDNPSLFDYTTTRCRSRRRRSSGRC